MERYIFLDFDGVLNSPNWYLRNKEAGTPVSMVKDLDRDAVARVCRIVEATGAKVVISSTWRLMKPLIWLKGILHRHGFRGEVIDKTPQLNTYRGHEIQRWMDDEGAKPYQIVILDDDSDMVHLMDRLVQTDRYNGLTDEHVDRAIALLNLT